MRSVALMMLLFGCAHSMPPTTYMPNSRDQTAIQAAADAWDDSDDLPPVSAECRAELEQMRVASVDDDGIARYCRMCPPGNCPGRRTSNACPFGCAGACPYRADFSTATRDKITIIVIHDSAAPGSRGWHRAILEESLHELERCVLGHARRGSPRDGPVWGPDGVYRRALERIDGS